MYGRHRWPTRGLGHRWNCGALLNERFPVIVRFLSSKQISDNTNFHHELLKVIINMSNRQERNAEDQYEAQNDQTGGDIPSGNVKTEGYRGAGGSQRGEDMIPVVQDDKEIEDPTNVRGAQNTDAQLGESTGC